MSEIINNAIVHYRDDLDLQNLIDFGQQKVRAEHGGVGKSSPPHLEARCLLVTCQVMDSGKGVGKKLY